MLELKTFGLRIRIFDSVENLVQLYLKARINDHTNHEIIRYQNPCQTVKI